METISPQSPAVQVLERTFAVLDVLPQHPGPVSLKLISKQTGLHPSTAHRILNDLTCGRLVERPEAGSYRLGMRLLELGNLVKARLDVRDAALKPMQLFLAHDDVQRVRAYASRSGLIGSWSNRTLCAVLRADEASAAATSVDPRPRVPLKTPVWASFG